MSNFPKNCSQAEVCQTAMNNKNYECFKVALQKMQKNWDTLGINSFKDSDKMDAEWEAKKQKQMKVVKFWEYNNHSKQNLYQLYLSTNNYDTSNARIIRSFVVAIRTKKPDSI